MKTSSKIIRPIVFGLIILASFMILSYIFLPKNNSKEAGMHQSTAYGFLGEAEKTIDVMFVGDSEAYYSIIPMQIYNKYGITSYVASNPSQRTYEAYLIFKKALERQDVKVLVMETYELHRASNIVQSTKGLFKSILPIFIYHNRWKTLGTKDFFGKVEYTWIDENKGYRFNDAIDPAKNPKYMEKTDKVKEIPSDNYYWFNKIYELCKENDVKLVLVSNPSAHNWNYAKHNGIEKIAKEFELEYIDLNIDNKVNIDWNHDTPDKGDHINYYGAKKVTNFIADYLNSLNILDDHRGDEKYKSYEDSLVKYLQNEKMN